LCFTTVERRPTKNFDGSDRKKDKTYLDDDEKDDFDEEEAEVPTGLAAT
jgi:hypothetical protein